MEKKEKYLQQIIDTYVKKDIRDLASVKDIDKFNKLLEALASQSGQLLNMRELSNTTRIAIQTIERYLFILGEHLYPEVSETFQQEHPFRTLQATQDILLRFRTHADALVERFTKRNHRPGF